MPRAKIGEKISVNVEDETVFKLRKIAKYHGISLADVTRLMIDTGLDSYEVFSLIGLPQIAELTKKVRNACTQGVIERMEHKNRVPKLYNRK